MRNIAVFAAVLLATMALSASTAAFDDSFPADIMAGIGGSLDACTEGRGSIDFTLSGYSEDGETWAQCSGAPTSTNVSAFATNGTRTIAGTSNAVY